MYGAAVTAKAKKRRAAPMAPEDRRSAIIDAVLPLLRQYGDAVTTRQIAEAAGVAEGTLFRAFPDKAALLRAAAEETMGLTKGRDQLLSALAGVTSLHDTIVIIVDHLEAASANAMAVLMVLRRLWLKKLKDGCAIPPGPPKFMVDANRALLDLLTEILAVHAAELAVEPRTAALMLRSLVLGSRHPGTDRDHRLGSAQIADLLLDGIRRRPGAKEA